MGRIPVKCVCIMGATATGKSGLGIGLARVFDGEVISMDSRQVYRGMDIGTGKVTSEECRGVPHHLLDILDPGAVGSAGQHARLAGNAVEDIAVRGRVPFLVGGTGLYFEALLNPLIDVDIGAERLDEIRAGYDGVSTNDLYDRLVSVDPQRAAALSRNDRIRITRALEIFDATGTPMSRHMAAGTGEGGAGREFEPLKIVLTMPRERLRETIARRTKQMYDRGWVQEVARLMEAGFDAGSPGMQSLGYGEIAAAISEGRDPVATFDDVVTRTRQYAKRQETWFRRETGAVWLDVSRQDPLETAGEVVAKFLGREFNKNLT